VGHKAIGRTLSDVAAMGGAPRWALVDLVLPADTQVETIEEVYAGANALAARFGLAIAGGDVTEGPALQIHTFTVGEAPAGAALLRSGASPGDVLFVTGELGGSAAGKHLSFEPRVREGQWLREWATAAIDVSDGVATDLRHVLGMSGAGARLNVSELPLSDAAKTATDGIRPLDHALFDGEDYELLFTASADRAVPMAEAWLRAFDVPCTSIGTMTEQVGVLECVDRDGSVSVIEKQAYEHFRRP
jgi:thiamine-monophosphate kinase